MLYYIKGKGGLINSKWLMIMDYARIEKDYGLVPIRILNHVTYMYYLAFFIVKDNPKKEGKAVLHDLLIFLSTSQSTSFNRI